MSAQARSSSWLVRATVMAPVAFVAVFAAGVVWYHAPLDGAALALLTLAWLGFAFGSVVVFARTKDWRVLTALAPPLAAILIWFATIEPSNDRVWSFEMAHVPTYARDGDTIVVRNVRNFDWTGPMTAEERWETRRYDLNALETVDVLSLYWKGPRVAHTYFSFVWRDGEALALSVEIRKEIDEVYSPIGGFFKAYELSVLVGDERDFYGWRVFYPEEELLLFRTRANPQEARELLLHLLDYANRVAATPRFYNTLTDNCTTEVWLLTEALGAGRPLDWRLFASGYLAEFLYDLKLLDTSRPLAELRRQGRVLPNARAAVEKDLTGAAFSRALRAGVPKIER